MSNQHMPIFCLRYDVYGVLYTWSHIKLYSCDATQGVSINSGIRAYQQKTSAPAFTFHSMPNSVKPSNEPTQNRHTYVRLGA